MASTSRWATPEEGSSSRTTDGWWATTAGQVDEAPGAGRQLADQVVGEAVEAEQVEELVDPLRRRPPRSAPAAGRRSMALKGSPTSVKRSSDTARASRTVRPGEQARVLEGAAQAEPGPGRRRAVGDVDAGQLDPPGVGTEEPGDDVEERGLAGAVGPDDADDLAVLGVERHVVEGGVAAEAEREPAHLELGPAIGRPPTARGAAPARPAPRRPSGGRRTTAARDGPPARRPTRRSARRRSP